ncbi:MAG: hypothetical protein ABTQ32_03935 [Myxococcaceae bacterium]
MKKAEIDMSPEAVEARLQEVVALNRLCASLMEAGKAAGLHDKSWDEPSPAGDDAGEPLLHGR